MLLVLLVLGWGAGVLGAGAVVVMILLGGYTNKKSITSARKRLSGVIGCVLFVLLLSKY